MSTVAHVPVAVNFNIEIDASGSITVFGQAPPTITNKVVAAVTLPVKALYDQMGESGSNNGALPVLNSMFEFWEPSDAIGTRLATLSGKAVAGDSTFSNFRDYQLLTKKFVMDMQAILDGQMDASGAAPFTNAMYTYTPDYYTHENFGRLALSSYAHYLFGHVAATAAITNDQAFMDAMLSKVDGAYKFATTADVDLAANAEGGTFDANLAVRILNAIIGKNDAAILEIVEQVLGQDASRAMDQDNNALAPGIRHGMRFIAGDKIYVNIRLHRPEVTVSASTNAGAPASSLYPDDTSSEVNYALEITLEDKEGAAFAA